MELELERVNQLGMIQEIREKASENLIKGGLDI